ncbi:MAG: metallophosphoesterase family protein [Myxococcota bacterium]
MKLLAVGDLHLGRRPPRLPEDLQPRASELGPAGAWRRLVEAAIREEVHAVVFAGDLVEREDDFFEAYDELYGGVRRLREARIEVLAVAGNHDVRVLPRLAREIPGFRLLGEGGVWEVAELKAAGERLAVWGWSFPERRFSRSPLPKKGFDLRPGLNLGLLHCDRDQSGGTYAPVSTGELAGAGLDGWLLGHIHKPDPLSSASPSGYLGSVAGLDPGEPSAHGPWLYTIERGEIAIVEQWVLAPLRWQPVEIDLTGIAEVEDARQRLVHRVRLLDGEIRSSSWKPEAVGLRVELQGRTMLGRAVRKLLSEEAPELTSGLTAHYFVESTRALTLPEVPLDLLEMRADPAGLLARRLCLLDRPESDPERLRLLESARRRLEARAGSDPYSKAETDELTDAAVADYLRRAASDLLERMLASEEKA